MAELSVTIILPHGSARNAEVPDDVIVRDLVMELTSLLKLPTIGPDGRPMGYRMDSKALGKELDDNPEWKPIRKNAYDYQQASDELIGWLTKKIETKKPAPIKKPLRKTTVDSFYNSPSTPNHIYPSAVLTGIKGDILATKVR